ncbi:MAG: acyl-CoA dehydrogenase [Chromatiales bacterium]|nr:MAG: acyl-CoA dehydrogenase [Chromatiales bacterium]
MTTYTPPLADINFCIRHLAEIDKVLSLDAFEGMEVEDLEQVLEEAGKFASDVVAPTNIPTDEQGCRLDGKTVHVADVLADVHRQFVENGWQSVAGDPEYDGMGLPSTVAFATAEMLQSANMAYSLMPMLTRDAVAALEVHANDELKQQYLAKLTTGEWAATMNLTEPQAGSDLSAVACRAEREGDQFRIRGNKIFITWGDHELSGNVIHTVLARIDGAPEGVRGISMFLVPKFLLDENGEPGERNDVYATALEHKLGIHGSPTAVMNFGDNEGAVGYLIGEENKGLYAMFTMMNHARLEVGLQGVAISERAYQLARSYANDRIQGRVPGREDKAPIIHHADVRRMLMLMRCQVEAMRAIAYTAASQDDIEHKSSDADICSAAGKRLSLLTPVVKGWCTETSEQVTSLGIQIHGGMGFVEETGAAQYYRDARILTIYEGTSGIQAGDLAGRKVLADEGRELSALISELRELCDSMQGDDALAGIAQSVRAGLGQLEEGMNWLIANAASGPTTTGAASFNLLMLAGTVLGGAYLAKSAAIATSASSSANEAFGKTKLATAAFYCAHVLPRAHGYLAAMMADPELTMAIAADSF